MKGLGFYSMALAGALLLTASIALYIGQATLAADKTGVVAIDRESEACLRKLVSRRFYNRISASDEQRKQLDEVFISTADQTRPLREELKSGALELSNLYAGDATDEVIKKKALELRALHETIMDKRIDAALAVRKLLTEEQRQKLNDRLQEILTNSPKRQLGVMIDAG